MFMFGFSFSEYAYVTNRKNASSLYALFPKNEQELISPQKIHTLTRRKVMRIKIPMNCDDYSM